MSIEKRIELPIHDITQSEFSEFKRRYLKGDFLSDEALKKISELYALGTHKVVYIDCDKDHAHGERCTKYNPEAKVVEALVKEIRNYKSIFEKMKELAGEQIGLIVVDSISMLYRLELGKNEEVYEINSALGKQLAYLVEIARRRKIPVLITNQVYSDFDNRDSVKMVGGDLLKNSSKCLIEMHRFSNCRGLTLRKHRSLAEGKEVKFVIVKEGIEEVK